MREKIQFESHNVALAGLLETPDAQPKAYVLFAHCFTCSKDVAAASRISRFLLQKGFAVFRFDFTGLGSSDGDFANSNYSSNMNDLVSAYRYLENNLQAPSILVGHSLGGAAVLSVANQLDKVKAVVTIGAPFEAQHVLHNFQANIDEIEREGESRVILGGRDFCIKKQFIDDLKAQTTAHIGNLKQALLVMHSPVDLIVDIRDAEKIYRAAKHPKSFMSLNAADHLLSDPADSEYVAEMIAGWSSRYLPKVNSIRPRVEQGQITVVELDHRFQQCIYSDHHHWYADEPAHNGGKNTGPDPYEHLLAGLGACTAMTVRMYANHKMIPLDNIEVSLSHKRNYLEDAKNTDTKPVQVEQLIRKIQFTGDLSQAQRERLLTIANKCPVHRTLTNGPQVVTEMVDS